MAQAAVRVALTSADMPFYARFERDLIHTDGEWAAVAFYRPPACVPADFNLLDFFDAPAAFGCNAPVPYLIGFAVFKNVPPGVPPLESGLTPIQSETKLAPGQSMPVWFVRWSELEAAIEDDHLTIGELEALPSRLKGQAAFYTETLHPLSGPGGQGAQQTMTSIVASGILEDGRKFTYMATETHNTLRDVKIEFK
jgi:hypothetical protein